MNRDNNIWPYCCHTNITYAKFVLKETHDIIDTCHFIKHSYTSALLKDQSIAITKLAGIAQASENRKFLESIKKNSCCYLVILTYSFYRSSWVYHKFFNIISPQFVPLLHLFSHFSILWAFFCSMFRFSLELVLDEANAWFTFTCVRLNCLSPSWS